MRVFEPHALTRVFETPGKLRYFQGLLKTSGNPLAMLALSRNCKPLVKPLVGVKTSRNVKNNPH